MRLNIAAFSFFFIELTFSSIGIKGYFGSFFFWLDLLSTVSIIADIEPLWEVLVSLFSKDDELASQIDEMMRI